MSWLPDDHSLITLSWKDREMNIESHLSPGQSILSVWLRPVVLRLSLRIYGQQNIWFPYSSSMIQTTSRELKNHVFICAQIFDMAEYLFTLILFHSPKAKWRSCCAWWDELKWVMYLFCCKSFLSYMMHIYLFKYTPYSILRNTC